MLRIADVADPTSLDPLLAHDQETIGYDLLVTQTLTGLDARNRTVPLLLTRVPSQANGDISRDGTRITYRLRRGVRFADGVEMTSQDVAFTYRAILDSRNNVLSQDAYRRIAALQTPDKSTVVIRLKHRWNAAVSDLFAQSDFAFGILPAHAFSGTQLALSAWEQHPFGTGPFRVSRWSRGDRIDLVPNPYFTPRPKLARIELRIIPDRNTAFVALRTRDVDVSALTTPQMIAQARSMRQIRILRTPLNGTLWLSLQTARGPASSPNVRRALAYALDMAPIRKTFEGLFPQAGSFLPAVMQPWYVAIAPYPHDARRARTLLGNRSIDAVMAIEAEDPLWTRIATVVQEQLAGAGVRIAIKKFPAPVFNAPDGPIRNGRFTVSVDEWLGGADPEQSIVLTCAQANVDGDNISRYCDPRFEALFADQERTASTARRRSDFAQMQHLVHAGVPVIPLYYLVWFDGVNANVHGFARNMLEYPVAPERWDVY